jgi:hypothetical protein
MIYRDKKTGKFVSKETWKRSKAHGGLRYVREKHSKRPIRGPVRPETLLEQEMREEEEREELEIEHEEEEEEEIQGGFESNA